MHVFLYQKCGLGSEYALQTEIKIAYNFSGCYKDRTAIQARAGWSFRHWLLQCVVWLFWLIVYGTSPAHMSACACVSSMCK